MITVHGRTRHQSSSSYPVDLASIKFARSCAKGQVPVIANGDVFDMADVERTRKETGAEGVMSARGLLANPVRRTSTITSRHHSEPLTVDYRLFFRDIRKRLSKRSTLVRIDSRLSPSPNAD